MGAPNRIFRGTSRLGEVRRSPEGNRCLKACLLAEHIRMGQELRYGKHARTITAQRSAYDVLRRQLLDTEAHQGATRLRPVP